MPVLDYLLIRELLGRGGARRALITWACLFGLVVVVWLLAGQDAVGTLVRLVLYGGVIALLCLPLLGLLWTVIWFIAMFGSADKKPKAEPAADPASRAQLGTRC